MSETTAATETGLQCSQGFETLQRVATMFSKSSLVPKEYQGNLPNCAIAVHMALRVNADPLMVMQNLYVVHGRPGWSSQFLIATFNQCGRFSSLRYEWCGTAGTDDFGCTACATEKATNEVLRGATITLAMARKEGWLGKNGSKWVTMPQQMLMYRAAAFFVRAYAPELAMGLPLADEINDTYDARPTATPRLTDIMASESLPQQPESVSLPPTKRDVEAATTQAELEEINERVHQALEAKLITPDVADTLINAIVERSNSIGGAE